MEIDRFVGPFAVAALVGMAATGGPALAFSVTEITYADFENPKVLDFDSPGVTDGAIGGTDAVFTDFGISQVTAERLRENSIDEYDIHGSNRALFSNNSILFLDSPGGDQPAFDLDTEFQLRFSDFRVRFGLSLPDFTGDSVELTFAQGETELGSSTFGFTPATALYVESDSPFDRILIHPVPDPEFGDGSGIDNITLEAVIPEPASLGILFGLGALGLVRHTRRRKKAA